MAAEVIRTDVCGIPAFYIERPGPLTASLAFRVGMADETLPTLGISHMVEHLVLFPQSRASCTYNGRTEDTRTLFYATGTADEIRDFLNGVTAALAALPLERLDTELRVLATEAAGRSRGYLAHMLSLRFGPRGHGLPAYPEHGLHTLEAATVEAWAADRFTRGNAALAFTGPPPDGLNLRLPDGPRFATPKAVTVPAEYPTFTIGERGGIGCSLLARRSSALTSLIRVIHRRATQHLRTELGISYAIDTSYQRLDDDLAHLTVAADALPDQTENVLGGLLHVLESLARTGPTPDELDRDFEGAEQAYAQEDAILAELDAAARYELSGEHPKTQKTLLRELREVTPDVQAELLDNALDTSLWIIPPATRYPAWRFKPFPDWSPTRVDGDKLRRRKNAGPKADTLLVAPEGISLARDDRAITVHFADCAAMLCWDSGDRVLYGADGFVLDVIPHDWRRGEELTARLDSSVSADRHVPMGEARTEVSSRSRNQLGEPTPKPRGWAARRLLRRR